MVNLAQLLAEYLNLPGDYKPLTPDEFKKLRSIVEAVGAKQKLDINTVLFPLQRFCDGTLLGRLALTLLVFRSLTPGNPEWAKLETDINAWLADQRQ